jgi:hypothetical protein
MEKKMHLYLIPNEWESTKYADFLAEFLTDEEHDISFVDKEAIEFVDNGDDLMGLTDEEVELIIKENYKK